MSNIYCAPQIKALQLFLGELLHRPKEGGIIYDYLEEMAQCIFVGVQAKVAVVYPLFNNYHRDYIGKPVVELAITDLSFTDCLELIAMERGFKNWAEVKALGERRFDPHFEQLLAALLAGDSTTVQQLLKGRPAEVQKTSPYPHAATLLHYMGSNGVEMWRQQVPYNLAEMIQLLLDAGADPDAKMQVYGGELTTAELLGTSAHPKGAGVLAAAMRVLA